MLEYQEINIKSCTFSARCKNKIKRCYGPEIHSTYSWFLESLKGGTKVVIDESLILDWTITFIILNRDNLPQSRYPHPLHLHFLHRLRVPFQQSQFYRLIFPALLL